MKSSFPGADSFGWQQKYMIQNTVVFKKQEISGLKTIRRRNSVLALIYLLQLRAEWLFQRWIL